jgi:hypothetical protein
MSEIRKRVIYQKPIGVVLQTNRSVGTGECIPTIIGMKGLLEKHDATTITLYNQYGGVPLLVVYARKST